MMRTFRPLFGAAFLALTATSSLSQSYLGGLRGLVRDQSGATVVGAQITLLDEMKKVTRVAISDSAGEYSFTSVDPATYSVRVEGSGFKQFKQTGLIVGAQSFLTVDVNLELGNASESVVVGAGDQPLLDTSDASTSSSLNPRQLTDLPSESGNGRNPFSQSTVSQNTVQVVRGSGMMDQSDTSTVSVAGSPEATNLYLVDGVPITDTINRPIIIPIVEATQELKVQVTTYDAEIGRTGGGVYNVLLKSGTNRLHGSLFGMSAQPEWQANSFFNNREGVSRPNVPFYDYAGSLGGPVWLPHLYNGRDKTFFFIAEEGFRQPQQLSSNYQVPTDAERAGDFSHSLNSAGALDVIYDPLTTTVDASGNVHRTPFPDNIIPAARLNPVGSAIASYYPLPNLSNLATGAVNYTAPAPGPEDRADEMVAKIDEQFFPWWAANVSYMHYGSLIPFGNALQTVPGSGSITYNRHIDATQLNNVFTINPSTVATVRFGFNRFPNTILPYSKGFSPTALGFPSYNYQYNFFPPVGVTDFTPLSASTASTDFWSSRNLFTQVSKYFGRHSVKAGFDFRGLYLSFTDFSSAPGNYNFTGQFTQADPAVATGGSSIADLLLGLPVSGQIEESQRFYNYLHYYGAYVQDDFRVTPSLTLNLGLRYEYETGLKDANNNLVVGFNRTVASPLASEKAGTVGGVEFAGSGGSTQCCDYSKLKFAPRVGFSYLIGRKTTARGGFATLYAPARYDATAALQPGYTTLTSLVSSNNNYLTPAPGFSFSNPFPGGPQPITGNADGLLTGVGGAIAAYDQNLKSPAIYQFSGGVQRELPGNFLLGVDYVASRSRHLIPSPQGGGSDSPAGGGRTNIDQLNPSYFSLGSTALSAAVTNPFYQTGGTGIIGQATVPYQQLLLPFPQFTAVNLLTSYSSASYNSLAIKVEKRYSSGLTLLSTYTLSSNDDGSYNTSTPSGSSNVGPQNVYDLKAEYGTSYINVPSRFTLAVNYELPFGADKTFLHGNGLLNWVVGGWEVNTITTYESGFPINISQNNLNGSIGAAVQRPNLNPGVSEGMPGSLYTRINGYLNPNAFTAVSEYQFGNAHRTIAIHGPGPGSGDWDMTLLKSFKIRELANFEFRAQSANVFNHPWFSMPNTVFGSSTFGQITGTYNTPRSLQLGSRMTF